MNNEGFESVSRKPPQHGGFKDIQDERGPREQKLWQCHQSNEQASLVSKLKTDLYSELGPS